MVICESRSEQKKKSLEASSNNSTLGGQDQKKGARSVQTGLVTGLTGPSGGSVLGGHEQRRKNGSTQTSLTGHSGSSRKNSRNNKKEKAEFQATLGQV